jgi:hypothetical protein
MRYTILLDKNEKTKEVEAQEQARFVKSIIEALEVPIEWNPEEPFSVESKLKFKKSLNAYNINVISDTDGGLKIFVGSDLIAEWYKCSYKLKQDIGQIDPNKKLFLEMTVSFWSIFEKNE